MKLNFLFPLLNNIYLFICIDKYKLVNTNFVDGSLSVQCGREWRDKLPLGPVHESSFGIDGDGSRMGNVEQDAPLGRVVQPHDSDGAATFVRPVQITAHPIYGQTLTRVQSVLEKHLATAAVNLLSFNCQSESSYQFHFVGYFSKYQNDKLIISIKKKFNK